MNKFKFLTKYSLIRKLKSKGFIISQIITSILVLVVTMLPAIIHIFSKDENISYEVLLIDETLDNKDILSYYELTTENLYNFKIEVVTNNYDDVISYFSNSKYDIIIHYPNLNLEDVSQIDFYSKLDTEDNYFLELIISESKKSILGLEDNIIHINDLSELSEDDSNIAVFVMGAGTFVFTIIFLFITFSTQNLGAEILEEKSTKAIETIISSVPAKTHFYSKITSSVIFTFIQLLLLGLVGIIGFKLSDLILGSSDSSLKMMFSGSGINVNAWFVVTFSIFGMLSGLLVYLIIFAFLASFANNNEEYQKAQSPLMIILMIVFYASIGLATANLVNVIKILSYIPFLTPFLLPIALLSGKMVFVEALIVIIINVLFIYLLTIVIVPTYRISILDYSGDKLFKTIKRSFKARKDV